MSLTRMTLLVVVMLAAASGVAAAAPQEQQQFPAARTQAGLCNDIKWSAEMQDSHPGLIDACREVVVADGQKWARFEAKFIDVDPDGIVHFSVRSRSGRRVEQVLLKPAPGQVARIDNEVVPFTRLRPSDRLNLYMPESQYGFATVPGATRLATVVSAEPAPAEAPPASSTTFAAVEPLPTRLPQTASPASWLGLSGILFLLAGLGLTLRRSWKPRSNNPPAGA